MGSGKRAAAGPVLPSIRAMVIRNYGRNVRFEPRRRVTPRTVEELAAVVRESAKVRAVGAAHSWSPAIVTDDTLVSLDRMRGVIALDRAASQVTVQGGMRLRELNAYLDRQGLALANLGSIDSQSVAGVIATGTHGTGGAFPCLSAQVARLELIDGTGCSVTIERGHPDLAGAVVGLGALGIVHGVTFDVVEAFRLHDTTCAERFEDVIERIDEHVAAVDHLKLWWLVPNDDAVVFRYNRTQEPPNDSALRRWVKDRLISVAVYRSLLAVGQLSRRRWIPGINRFLTRQAGKPLDRITPSPIGFLTPIPPSHAESEWAFDVASVKPLLRDYRRMLLDGRHRYSFIQELRFSRGDELWLSPAYQRDSVWLSLYNIDRRNWPQQLAAFESFARDHGGRPHWGKEATFDRDYLRGQYARLDDFAALAARYDPERKFRNDWLDRILGG
ncbi:MAG: D-arabinono-1,4-lactone oxidase [Kofleriaceae bacterium]